ncbi:Asp-tRNA(Asn)/Glu-tRNA(Gln) amidotransferase subunit GatB [Rhodothermus marinus]|uniref:Asp-tRNA(Asn)/Glu-tRNA(Gln) amidotransferase subunit GatB n=1 Tax=Rhodothermus marinus TaxID=29549 RepID=UPI0012BA4FCB|nr:Asp-tRNA(Asn)/Glu-tRNA(Gln) amidotransferase subunit GatB [Rhodothermus marinus]BBM69793.1 aspartyl/glutamyl-tRNA(Asn/Gln) amidotransferase subunit B [Rhodothermus marinus]BBM72779.1 aspartyl/glutamyl-tRNA(Asn/Gln) amidotransferase subunit B [Rhodothermus marinus]
MRHDYEAVIGLEVHCQLLTASKAFSPESTQFGDPPNTNVDPISLGHPGTLPVLNARMVEYTIRMGLATNCKIAERSIFARKHYFYPDLPKGYQISQYETPICYDGWVEIELEPEGDGQEPVRKRIGIIRIHMEEDAGKSLHDQDPYHTLLDFNRCGVPLIEIVSAPDIRSPREAALYMQKIRQIVRYLGISDGNMEEGSLRCDANVSVRRRGETKLGTKTEIKNLNSFRNVERALEYEIRRQIAILERGGEVVQETRLWDAVRQETRPMRTKEEAHDYRYFPDPDLVPVVVTADMLERIRAEMPEMPEVRRQRFMEELSLPAYDAGVLTEERGVADYYEATLAALARLMPEGDRKVQAKAVSNFVMTEVLRVLNERSIDIREFPIEPERLAELVRLRLEDRVSSSGAQEIFNTMLEDPRRPEEIAEAHNLLQVSDESALIPVVEAVLAENPDKVQTYLNGKTGLLGFFIGQVMRRFEGAPDPKLVRRLLEERLEAARAAGQETK